MPTTHPRPASNLRRLYELVSKIQPDYPVGRICHVTAKTVDISGLAAHAAIGDRRSDKILNRPEAQSIRGSHPIVKHAYYGAI